MAIDFGTKRMGIAVTDPLKIIASALITVQSKDIISFLEKYFSGEQVECIVVGDPANRGMNKKISKLSDDFCKNLKRKFPDKVIERMDEFYTSKIAFRTIVESGLRKKARQNKGTVDKVSATIILQSFMEKKNG